VSLKVRVNYYHEEYSIEIVVYFITGFNIVNFGFNIKLSLPTI